MATKDDDKKPSSQTAMEDAKNALANAGSDTKKAVKDAVVDPVSQGAGKFGNWASDKYQREMQQNEDLFYSQNPGLKPPGYTSHSQMQTAAASAGVTPVTENPVANMQAGMSSLTDPAITSFTRPKLDLSPVQTGNYRPVYNPQAAGQEALSKVNPFVQHQMDLALQRASTMEDPKARENYLTGVRNSLGNVQSTFAQNAQGKAAVASGLVQQNPDGSYRTMATDAQGKIIRPEAGQMIDQRGNVTGLDLTRPTASPDGNALTFHPKSGGSATFYLNGTHPSAAQMAGIPFRPDATKIEASKPGSIEGVPGNQFLQENAQRMIRQGMVNSGSQADLINQQINTRIKEGKDFGDLLTQSDKLSRDPDFNRSKVVAETSDAPADPYANLPVDPRSYDAVSGVNPSAPKNVITAEDAFKYRPYGGTLPSVGGGSDSVYQGDTAEKNYALPSVQSMDNMAQNQRARTEAENAPLRQEEATRARQYAAKQQMEEAMKPQPNGDPLRDAQIALGRKRAAEAMAQADGVDLQQNPGAVEKYLPKPTGVGSASSTRHLNDLVKSSLSGASIEDLVRQAVYANAGGSSTALGQNARAVEQARGTSGIAAKDAAIVAAEERNQDRDENRAVRTEGREATAKAQRIAGLERNLISVGGKLADLQKDQLAVKGNPGLRRAIAQEQAIQDRLQKLLDKEQGIDTSEAGGNNTPQPNQESKKMPKIGDIEDGHKFKGGDPADKKNWVKI